MVAKLFDTTFVGATELAAEFGSFSPAVAELGHYRLLVNEEPG